MATKFKPIPLRDQNEVGFTLKKYSDGKSDRNREGLIEKCTPTISFLGHTCTCK